jgi:hypothetical protein
MKGSNIYDIDGELIRRGDQGAFTLEETEELVDKLTKKVQENPDNQVYKVYLNNAQKWLFKLYNEMKPEDLMKRMSFLQNSVDEAKNAANEAEQAQLEEINKAIEELKNEYDNLPEMPEVATVEGTGYEQLDRPVECPMGITSFTDVNSESPVELNMDEYVEPIEEVKDGE